MGKKNIPDGNTPATQIKESELPIKIGPDTS
jgi:hypothetical protein